MKRTWVVIAAGAALSLACETELPLDAGVRSDASLDAPMVTVCAADSECDDGTFCSEWRCLPGDSAADARGCIDRGAPCTVSETCDEAADRCVPVDCTESDADGDGHDSIACGGADCDDADPNINPGVAEVCDAAGVDEDCNADTIGDTDADGDGHISALCCNGTTCGTDCDDDNALVHPDVGEICDGVDNDCSGVADDAAPAAPLCPGGTCTAGRCAFSPFDRIFGGDGDYSASGLDVDALGNLYVTGPFGASVDFGAGPVANPYVVSFAPDGVLRWRGSWAGTGFAGGLDIAVDATGAQLYVTAPFNGTVTFGSERFDLPASGRQVALIALDLDGAVQWSRPLPESVDRTWVAVVGGRLFVSGTYAAPFDFGAGMRTPNGSVDSYILEFGADGALQNETFLGGPSASVLVNAISGGPGGSLVIAGEYSGTVDFGTGPETPTGTAAGFVWATDPTAGRLWHRIFDAAGATGSARVFSLASSDAMLFVGSQIVGAASLGGDVITAMDADTAAISGYDGVGAHVWSRALDRAAGASEGSARVASIAVLEDTVVVAGSFSGTIDFGGGGVDSTSETFPTYTYWTEDVFVARYRATDRLYLRDRSYGDLGDQRATQVAIGPGGSTNIAGWFSGTINFGGSTRSVPPGTSWPFVARLAD